ncbi:hypothetical protein C0J26_01740 [Pseudomonas baetica]|nr:hypothetical protein C0J26_01740 [Pseudomonas baetica]
MRSDDLNGPECLRGARYGQARDRQGLEKYWRVFLCGERYRFRVFSNTPGGRDEYREKQGEEEGIKSQA